MNLFLVSNIFCYFFSLDFLGIFRILFSIEILAAQLIRRGSVLQTAQAQSDAARVRLHGSAWWRISSRQMVGWIRIEPCWTSQVMLGVGWVETNRITSDSGHRSVVPEIQFLPLSVRILGHGFDLVIWVAMCLSSAWSKTCGFSSITLPSLLFSFTENKNPKIHWYVVDATLASLLVGGGGSGSTLIDNSGFKGDPILTIGISFWP